MFAVFCPRHRARVLLSPGNIVRLNKRAGALELHWICTCGATGVERLAKRVHEKGAHR